jgi:glycosyltransferase involved in cell wall biosynthesis
MAPHRAEDRSIGRFDDEHPYGVNVICANADQYFEIERHVGASFFRGRYNIGVWFWELPSFPAAWHDRFAQYQELWVATSFVAGTLAPVSPIPVVRVPPVLGVARPGSRERGRARLGVAPDELVVLFVFDFWSYVERKNPLALIEAFKRAFHPAERVRLVVKSVNESVAPAAFERLRECADGHPISILTGYWSSEELRDLMAACDVYASLHRSEGLGLTMSDAMAHGKPVIATAWSGNTDFMNVSNSYPVRFTLVPLVEDFGPYRKGEIWADADVEHAALLLREVFEDRDGARQRGEIARRDIETQYSADQIARLVGARLDAISQRLILAGDDSLGGLSSAISSGRMGPDLSLWLADVRRRLELQEHQVAHLHAAVTADRPLGGGLAAQTRQIHAAAQRLNQVATEIARSVRKHDDA